MRLEQSVIMNREAQSSDAALFRKDLPKSGSYSALDIGVRLTNGATSGINVDLLKVLKHISLVCNGNDYRWHISGHDFFRNFWLKHGRPMPYNWTEAASGVNEVWFRMEFGRFLGDPQYGLDLSRFNNVQLQIDYDATLLGAAAATTFASGTFTVTIIAHQFPYSSRPSFRGMLGCREFYTATSAASGDIVEDLPSSVPVLGLVVAAREDNVAEATDITDIEIGKDNFSIVYNKGKWYNFQAMQNADLDVREEIFDLLLTSGATRVAHLANLRSIDLQPRAAIAGAA